MGGDTKSNYFIPCKGDYKYLVFLRVSFVRDYTVEPQYNNALRPEGVRYSEMFIILTKTHWKLHNVEKKIEEVSVLFILSQLHVLLFCWWNLLYWDVLYSEFCYTKVLCFDVLATVIDSTFLFTT